MAKRVARSQVRTQEQADAWIDYYHKRASACEKRRDACAFESKEYWHHHDRALFWYFQAEQLMPELCRSIKKEWL